MAGTFPGIAGAQQNDLNGKPLDGAQLTIYQGGTTTLAALFQDIGLTLPYVQNPLTADASGRLPLFFVADGTYSVRLTDKNGVTTNGGFYWPQVPSIGASSSGGGGGSTVDPTTIFATGDMLWLAISGARTGWVRINGRTIGSGTSGATERANSDTQALFIYNWNTYSNTKCPVSGGRGASGLADFTANKTIQLLDFRGRAPVGLDDMGNTPAGVLTSANLGVDPTVAANAAGEESHVNTIAETPSHNHGGVTGDTQPTAAVSGGTLGGSTNAVVNDGSARSVPAGPSAVVVTIQNHHHTVASQGGGAAHNNVQPVVLGTFYQKL